ncbi:MAG: TonB-dependent receptor [Saprospiraceae bacterium]|nr:TonB-dependent receptor [Saprospiraceae bacterium]
MPNIIPKRHSYFGGSSPSIRLLLLTTFFGGFLSLTSLVGQSDSTLAAKPFHEILILDQPVGKAGYTVWKPDSLPVQTAISLAQRLFFEGTLNVRQYGPGLLASISSRGVGAARTSIIWNGMNLQSPMNGTADASLIPLWPSDKLEVFSGGVSAALSSGAMGGAILIKPNQPDGKDGLGGSLAIETGCFDLFSAKTSIDYRTTDVQLTLRGQWQQAKNDFPFYKKDLAGKFYKTRQLNNEQDKLDVQWFGNWQINEKHLLKAAAWRLQAFRQLPPAKTESVSETWQCDAADRLSFAWEYALNKKSILSSRIAFLDEFIQFYLNGATERSNAQTYLLNTEWKQSLKRINWMTGIRMQRLKAISDGYGSGIQPFVQNRPAWYATVERRGNNRWNWAVSARKEWVAHQHVPFTWNAGASYQIRPNWFVNGHLARTFNLPTFNDLYWKTLGNPDLKAEKGCSADIGGEYRTALFSVALKSFGLVVNDWILWQPGTDGLFRPSNLNKVSGRGIELNSHRKFRFNKWHFKVNGQAQYSVVKNLEPTTYQLPYNPRWLASAGFWANYRNVSGIYLHQFTGSRFITNDQAAQLPAFHTGHLFINYAGFKIAKRQRINLDLVVENIWNQQYEILANRPMPGMALRGGISWFW